MTQIFDISLLHQRIQKFDSNIDNNKIKKKNAADFGDCPPVKYQQESEDDLS